MQQTTITQTGKWFYVTFAEQQQLWPQDNAKW